MSTHWTETEVVVLAPDWHLHPNWGAGVVYHFSQDDSRYIYLDTFETVALTACDGETSLAELKQVVADILTLDLPDAERIVDRLVQKHQNHGPFLAALPESGGMFTRVNASRILRELADYSPQPQPARRLQVPLSLVLAPTYSCQTDCIYCYAERPLIPRSCFMSVARWVEILSEAGALGIDMFTFSGGDPLTYPGLDELLKVASAFRISCLLPTKSAISAPRAHELARWLTQDSAVQFSVDTFDPVIADRMTRARNFAARARSSIRNLRAAGLRVRSNTVVTPLNLSSVEETIRELHALGVSQSHFTGYYRTHYRHDDSLFLSAHEIESLHGTVNRLRDELNWNELSCNAALRDFSKPESHSEEQWKARATCGAGFSSLSIVPNGDVLLCEQVPHDERFVVGNVVRDSLLQVWNSERLLNFIVPPRELFDATPCRECSEFDHCHRIYGRCFRDSYFSFGRIYGPSPNCPRADLGFRIS